ncbi:MAG: hypothetical protein V1928_01880 [Parcubacteria group bacterium]
MRAFFQEKEIGTFKIPNNRKLIYIPDLNISIDYTDDDITVSKEIGVFVMAPLFHNFPDEIIRKAQTILRYNEEMEIFYTPALATERHEARETLKTMLLHFLANEMIESLKEKERLKKQ